MPEGIESCARVFYREVTPECEFGFVFFFCEKNLAHSSQRLHSQITLLHFYSLFYEQILPILLIF